MTLLLLSCLHDDIEVSGIILLLVSMLVRCDTSGAFNSTIAYSEIQMIIRGIIGHDTCIGIK